MFFIFLWKCDPYNARFHHHGQRVIRYDHATPVEWVMEEGLSLEEAQRILDSYTCDLGDDYSWYDDNAIEGMKEALREDDVDIATVDFSWYKGEGVYTCDELVYKHGDMALRDDVMLYSIEEME